jgi:hypothetical protein
MDNQDIIKFEETLNEARLSGKEAAKKVLAVLKDKPQEKKDKTKSKWPVNRDGLYSQAFLISYLTDKGLTSQQVTNGLYTLKNDKEFKDQIAHVRVHNYENDQWNPYYYCPDELSKTEAEKIAKEYETESEEKSESDIKQRQESKLSLAKNQKKRKPTKKSSAEDKKKNENMEIKKFSDYENESQKDQTNEALADKGVSKTINDLKDETKNPLPISKPTKNISVFLDDVSDKVLSVMKDKGVLMSTYAIAGCCGTKADDVNNVLQHLADGGKIVKKTVGKDNFWFIHQA